MYGVERQEHYGSTVWVNAGMDLLRKTQCLCLDCDEMQKEGPCVVGLNLFNICQKNSLALAVTRCPNYKPK
jgi:hypothetical protein